MWPSIAHFILRNRIYLLITVAVLTVVMGYNASKVSIDYEFAQLLPSDDSTLINHKAFKKQFGEDGTVMVVGFKDASFFELQKFNDFIALNNNLKKQYGIKEVVSVARLFNLTKNDSLQQFEFKPIITTLNKITQPITTQQQLDSVQDVVTHLPFYNGFVFSKDSAAYLVAITFDQTKLNSKERFAICDSLVACTQVFASKHKLTPHYSGLPFIRSFIAKKILHEMQLFMALAFAVTAIILFMFFRSFRVVGFSMLVVLIGVIWSFAFIYLLGFKITALSGLIAPLIIVIGVPNCILLLNKYHHEIRVHGHKIRALHTMTKNIGVSLFFANVTTSIGFFVFAFTGSKILVQFGYVASASVMMTYILSLLLIPSIFSYLPMPKLSTLNRGNYGVSKQLLSHIDYIVHHHRKTVYIIVGIVTVIGLYGMTKITALGYVVDDLPAKDKVYTDLNFFQQNFHGVLPFEVSIDTRKPNGAMDLKTLYKVNKFQKMLAKYNEFSKPLSVVEAVKFSNQAMNDGAAKHYIVPNALQLGEISKYAKDSKQGGQGANQFKAFMDSTKQKMRVSVQMADVGSVRLKALIAELKPRTDSIFNYDAESNTWLSANDRYNVVFTGTSIMFLKGNDYLVTNLIESVGIAIILIAIVMFMLFMSFRMVVIALVPSLIPLLITAGLMGYAGIHLKPSTILIFSIAFGIASDGTLYFLTKYRYELKNATFSISKAVSNSIHETGISMIYTAVILFFGFGIFAASSFGGTAALGILVSTTLAVAYASNLILLPCFLLSLENSITRKAMMKEPLFDIYDEDSDIDYSELHIEK
ncbi:MAG: efflux RND transporter permease subunit [Bacteroidia bacterium]